MDVLHERSLNLPADDGARVQSTAKVNHQARRSSHQQPNVGPEASAAGQETAMDEEQSLPTPGPHTSHPRVPNARTPAHLRTPGPARTPVRGHTSEELSLMLKNVIQLAAANKITSSNTWELKLIDHLDSLVRDSGTENQQTNFQHASVTLEAGVKIYSVRVDNVHQDAYKALSGLSRASAPAPNAGGDGGDSDDEGEGGEGGPGQAGPRRRQPVHDANPSATLEEWEALNVKKFDLAFAVDPLFHKTSAQFDEGGARGLLLNNLGVFRGCTIVFDSSEVPDEAVDSEIPEPADVMVDLGPLRNQLESAAAAATGAKISPSLDELCRLAGRAPDERATDAAARLVAGVAGAAASSSTAAAHEPMTQSFSCSPMGSAPRFSAAGPSDARAGDYDDTADFGGGFRDDDSSDGGFEDDGMAPDHGNGLEDEVGNNASSQLAGQLHTQHTSQSSAQGGGMAGLMAGGLLPEWLSEGGAAAAQGSRHGWAGPSHWQYHTALARSRSAPEQKPAGKTDRKKAAKQTIDFEDLGPAPPGWADPSEDDPSALPQPLLPRRPEATLLKKIPGKAKTTTLPEDEHYKVEDLARLFLLPNLQLLGRGGGQAERLGDGGAEQQPGGMAFGGNDFDAGGNYSDYDDNAGNDMGGDWGGGDSYGAAGEEDGLVNAPRRIEKLTMNYARASKQVDVRALKEELWHCLASTAKAPGSPSRSPETVVSFQQLLSRIPPDTAAGRPEDLSVHLCFICLLHLANEHGLAVRGVPSLDQLLVTDLPAGLWQ